MNISRQTRSAADLRSRCDWSTLVLFLFLGISGPVFAMDEVPVYGAHEITLTSTSEHSNKYADVTLSATFQGPNRTITIPGYWDGGDTWRIRIAPTETGTWTLTSVSSNDPLLNGQLEGVTFDARPATADEVAGNEVLRHGFVRVSSRNPYQFEHADGTPFFLMSDTLWGGRCNLGNHFETGKFQQIIDNKVSNGFTSVNLCNLNSQSSATNEGGAPFNGSYSNESINPAYFQWVDRRIEYMNERGIVPLIVLGDPNQGFSPSTQWVTRFTKYIVARYAAYDVFWFGIKEYEDLRDTAASTINAYGDAIQSSDPYGHPTSTHVDYNSNAPHGTSELDGRDWLDFHAMQDNRTSSLESLYSFGKPVFVSESHYEAICGYTDAWSYSNDSSLLRAIWEYYVSGGSMGGHFIPCYDIDQYLANMDTVSIAYHKHLSDFFTNNTDFFGLAPRNDLIVSGTARLLVQVNNGAPTGQEYVAFLPGGGTISVNLANASGTIPVRWFNPRSGSFSNGPSVDGEGTRSLTAPSSESWVLHLSTDTPGNQPAVPEEPTELTAD